MSRSQDAVQCFRAGCNCSQAVLSAFAEDYDLDDALALRLACGFGGGVGRSGSTCGAVTGAVLVIGLAEATPDARSLDTKNRVYNLVQEFIQAFTATHRSTVCRELLECDISVPEGYMEAQSLGLFQNRCPTYVEDAVAILEEML